MNRLKQTLSYLMLGQTGGENRFKIIDLLKERPSNVNQISKELDLNYRTVKHHIDVLVEHEIITPSGKGDYGEVYFLSPSMENNLEVYEDLKQNQEEMETSTEIYHSILEQTHNGVMVIDEEKDVIFVNEKGASITGYPEKDLLGDSIDFFTEEDFLEKGIEKVSDGEEFSSVETDAFTKSGEKICLRVTLDRIKNEDTLVYSLIFEDITEKKKKEEKLKKSESRLRRSQKVAKVGTWELNLEDNSIIWSDETYRIFGVPKGEKMDYEIFLDIVHPDDRDHVDKKWKEGLEQGDYDIDHRIIVDEETKWVREKANIQFNEKGDPIDVIGSVQDITKMKNAMKRIKFLNSLIESIKDVNQQLLKNDDFDEVIKEVPSLLLGTRGFTNIVISMKDDDSVLRPVSQAGTHKERRWKITEDFTGEDAPRCIERALDEQKEIIIDEILPICKECPYSGDMPEHQTAVIPMLQDGSVIGAIRACYEPDVEINEKTLELLREVSDDLIYAKMTKG